MKEVPKRLSPKSQTIRELYLKSGNQCAFQNCNELIIDKDGSYIGELCHIEAALPGGERFNEDQNNEQRRSFSNLMLMCHKHHVTTNNVDIWTTIKMKELKKKHESKFTNIADKIIDTLIDYTKTVELLKSSNLNKINRVLEWDLKNQDLQETLESVNKFASILSKIPLKTRSVLSIILERSYKDFTSLHFSPNEIEEACQIDSSELIRHVGILDKAGMISTGLYDNFGNPVLELRDIVGWDLWQTIREFCDKEYIKYDAIIFDLDFTLFDE